MDTLFTFLLALHIVGGFAGLATGTYNIIRRKGDTPHKKAGRIFSYSMYTAGTSALFLSILHPNYFLFIVGIFTIYMTATGNRYLHLRLLGMGQKPAVIDIVLSLAMLVMSLAFIILGTWHIMHHNNFGIVFIVFGLISLRFVSVDFNHFRGRIKMKNYWLLAHLQRMTGSYIASLTAFLVVNIKYLPFNVPSFIIWLLPTLILGALITKWSFKYAVPVKKQ